MNEDRQWSVYRLYDVQDHLLYVGSAVDPERRLREHEVCKEWYDRASRVTVTWYPHRREAMDAEREAIKTEDPWFNGNRWSSNRISATVTDDLLHILEEEAENTGRSLDAVINRRLWRGVRPAAPPLLTEVFAHEHAADCQWCRVKEYAAGGSV